MSIFDLFLSSTEKKLLKLGYGDIVKNYKKQLKNKTLDKKLYQELLEQLLTKNEHKLFHLDNVNVATRQNFQDFDVLPALNVSKITIPEYDLDFVKSKIYFNFKNNQQIIKGDIEFLFEQFKKEFHYHTFDSVTSNELPISENINYISEDYTSENKEKVFSAFITILQNL